VAVDDVLVAVTDRRVVTAVASEPAPVSVRANEATHRPMAMSRRYLSFCSSVPWSWRIWEQRPMVVENRDR